VYKDKAVINMEEIIKNNRKWMEQRQKELQVKEAELAKLTRECESIRKELAFMAQWLASVTNQSVAEDSGEGEFSATGKNKPAEDFSPKSGQVYNGSSLEEDRNMELRGDRLRDEVAAILQEAFPEALYYRDILQILQDKGYKISGKNPGLNLIAHLTHDDRFERGEKRGYYLLSANYANK